MLKDIKMIADFYGLDRQTDKLIEELAELIVALQKYKLARNEALYDVIEAEKEVVTEMADVYVMIAQISYKLRIEKQVEEEMDFKIDRQLKRMEAEV